MSQLRRVNYVGLHRLQEKPRKFSCYDDMTQHPLLGTIKLLTRVDLCDNKLTGKNKL